MRVYCFYTPNTMSHYLILVRIFNTLPDQSIKEPTFGSYTCDHSSNESVIEKVSANIDVRYRMFMNYCAREFDDRNRVIGYKDNIDSIEYWSF